jgi:site-specific recombinase XerD
MKRTYLLAVREFIAFHEITSVDELPQIDQAHIITWRNDLIERGASPRTVNARISAMSSLFKHLCEKQIVHRNPTIGVKRPRINAHEVKSPVITPAQVRKLLEIPNPSRGTGTGRFCISCFTLVAGSLKSAH